MTKPIVSVGVLMLVEAGQLGLEDPLTRYIPEFADATVYAGVEDGRIRLAPLERPITVEHLLTHTSGLSANHLIRHSTRHTTTLGTMITPSRN